MAKLHIKTSAEFSKQLLKLDKESEAIAKKAIFAGAGPVADKLRAEMQKNLDDQSYLGFTGRADRKNVGYEPTGSMADKFGITKMEQDKLGNWNVHIGWDGYDPNGRANQLKANVMESGNSKQKARPFVKPTVAAMKNRTEYVMGKIIEDEMKKIMK